MKILERSHVILLVGGAAVGLIIGVLVGHVATSGNDAAGAESLAFTADQFDLDERQGSGRGSRELLRLISTENIGQNLRELTKAPHVAGGARDEELVRWLQRKFLDFGFDDVSVPAREYLLSHPDPLNPNLVRLYDGDNTTTFTSSHKELPLHPGDEHPEFSHAFSAYTPRGDVWTAVGEAAVYVNYGSLEDFARLAELNVTVKGRIAIVRYGKLFRGNKITHAAQYGAIGVILFSDPSDVAREGQKPEDVYPHTHWLPGTGIQRGTTLMGSGDPLTPGWPSTDTAYRIPKEDAGLPTIPAQPIGYADARRILETLDGPAAPQEWQGGLEGLVYRLGPTMRPEFATHRLRLTSNNNEVVVKSSNVIATLKGGVEPERYVFVGNHRDAWGYGASDPSSGTAQLVETARVLGQLVEGGWRPRRTIVLCSWGAEEFGLIGSTEWVEEHEMQLAQRAVAYINTDTCASGPYVQLKASPLLWGLNLKVTAMVPGVRDAGKSLLDEWIENDKLKYPDAAEYPVQQTLGSGSDYAAFLFYLGIPSLDVWFRANQAEHPGTYPAYHTGYETYHMLANLTDPGFRVIQGCGRVALLTLKSLADSRIIPFSPSFFPIAMRRALKALHDKGKEEILLRIYPKYKYLTAAVDELVVATQRLEESLKGQRRMSAMRVRFVNEQLMALERTFVLPGGLPDRPLYRHSVFSPPRWDAYAAAGFSGLSDLLHDYDENDAARKEKIKGHINELTILTQRASAILKDSPVL